MTVDAMEIPQRRLALFPRTTAISASAQGSHLSVGGCDLAELASIYGTPLYVYDVATMDAAAEAYKRALAEHYPGPSGVTYAGKAYMGTAIARWAADQNFWVDCTGAGEIAVAVAAGVVRAQILVHGVNKSAEDLQAAMEHAGRIVVDNLSELGRLAPLYAGRKEAPGIWLRVRPGIAVDTHSYRQTGQVDSKFGMGLDEVLNAVQRAHRDQLPLMGLHFHQGSHFHDPAPIAPALATLLDLIGALREQTGWLVQELSPGGGWGVPYHEDELPHPPIEDYVAFVAGEIVRGCRERNLALPRLQLEPGRSLVAQAGVALYRVGAVKHTPGRRWLLIDGGMADNPRPALYGARYSALPVVEPLRPAAEAAWIAGPYCESGDVLIEELALPAMAEDELLAVPVSGAYNLAMGSNYNGARRPAVVWVNEGEERVVQRRQTVRDLLALDERF